MPQSGADLKLEDLRRALSGLGKAAVAFSGGVDSTFLLAVAAKELGAENVLALTSVGSIHPAFEKAEACRIAGLPFFA